LGNCLNTPMSSRTNGWVGLLAHRAPQYLGVGHRSTLGSLSSITCTTRAGARAQGAMTLRLLTAMPR
jgi:hypothetical protein